MNGGPAYYVASCRGESAAYREDAAGRLVRDDALTAALVPGTLQPSLDNTVTLTPVFNFNAGTEAAGAQTS